MAIHVTRRTVGAVSVAVATVHIVLLIDAAFVAGHHAAVRVHSKFLLLSLIVATMALPCANARFAEDWQIEDRPHPNYSPG